MKVSKCKENGNETAKTSVKNQEQYEHFKAESQNSEFWDSALLR